MVRGAWWRGDGELLGGSGRQVPVQAGPGDPGPGDDLGDGVAGVAQVRGVGELGRVDQDGPADPPAFRGRDRPGVRGSLQGVGAFHLPEQRQQHDREPGHRVRRVRRIDPDRIGEVTHSHAALCELVDQVESVADGAAEPVQGVHHDHIAVAGVGQRRLQPGPVGRGTGLLVQVDPLRRDPGLMQGVDLPVQVLLGRRDPRVSQLHRRTVPEVLLVRLLRHAVVELTCGTPARRAAPAGPARLLGEAIPLPRMWDGHPAPRGRSGLAQAAVPGLPSRRCSVALAGVPFSRARRWISGRSSTGSRGSSTGDPLPISPAQGARRP